MSSKKKEKQKKKEEGKGLIRELLDVAFYGLALLMFFRVFVFQNFQIPTSSMENTLLIGDHITANMFMFKPSSKFEKSILPFREIKRGDVIVFKYPGNERQDWIKRCIGLPGDRFQLIQDQVYINEAPLREAYPFFKRHRGNGPDDRDPDNRNYPLGYFETKPGLEHAEARPGQSRTMEQVIQRTKETLRLSFRGRKNIDKQIYEDVLARLEAADGNRIPEGFFMMMGDNRNNSHDSRAWGLVPREFVQGRAWLVWWSYGEDVNSHQRAGLELIWSYIRVPLWTFWTRTHWEKCFTLIK